MNKTYRMNGGSVGMPARFQRNIISLHLAEIEKKTVPGSCSYRVHRLEAGVLQSSPKLEQFSGSFNPSSLRQ